jgi:hypothetical protein
MLFGKFDGSALRSFFAAPGEPSSTSQKRKWPRFGAIFGLTCSRLASIAFLNVADDNLVAAALTYGNLAATAAMFAPLVLAIAAVTVTVGANFNADLCKLLIGAGLGRRTADKGNGNSKARGRYNDNSDFPHGILLMFANMQCDRAGFRSKTLKRTCPIFFSIMSQKRRLVRSRDRAPDAAVAAANRA